MRAKHDIVEEMVRGKRVVHYGCIDDDEDLIALKFKDGYYLHKIVTDSSKSTIGVDLNKKGISFLDKKLGISNVVHGNVEDPNTFDISKKKLKDADVVLIPDLIEHLKNPGQMLDSIRKTYSKDVKVIITTPNPFAWYNFAATLLNKEIYSPYHTAQFSIQNMKLLLDSCGFTLDKVTPVFIPKQRNPLVRVLDSLAGGVAVAVSPGFADNYLYECSIKTK